MTIKICSKFNTIEWQADELPSTQDLQEVYNVLSSIEVKEEDKPQRAVKKQEAPKKAYDEEPVTEAQKGAMVKLGIEIPKNCTKAQARALMMKWNEDHNTGR